MKSTALKEKKVIILNVDKQNSMEIHRTAIVEEGAILGNNVKIGPYSIIGKNVKIGDNTEVKSHVVIEGNTKIGKNNVIFPFASIGSIPQDLKYHGENSKLVIGDNNTIREHVTINPGTENGKMTTIIGNDCLLMVGAHVAHDCVIGDNCILANNATLAGHVQVDDYAIVGGLSAVHQFVRIGKYAIIGGMSGVEKDVIPYGSVKSRRAFLNGLNLIGLKRNNFDSEDIKILMKCYKEIFCSFEGTLMERVEQVSSNAQFKKNKAAKALIDFLMEGSSRPICQPIENYSDEC